MRLNKHLLEMAADFHDINYLMLLIYQLVHDRAQYTPRYFAVELGTRTGNSTVSILAGLAAAKTGRLISCDVEPCPEAENNVAKAGLQRYWTFVQSDSVEFAKGFAKNAVNLLFVDTLHEYDQTARELTAWTPLVAPGGRILLHDTCTSPEGVGRAVRDFVAANPTWRYYNIDVCCGLGVLDKPLIEQAQWTKTNESGKKSATSAATLRPTNR